MTEKGERILIARSTDYTITDTDKGARFEGKIAPHCANVFTRQEAIERMAKGIVSILAVQPGTEPDPWEMWKDYAEAALNALLEVEK